MNFAEFLISGRGTPRRTCYQFHIDNLDYALRNPNHTEVQNIGSAELRHGVLALYLLDVKAYRSKCENLSADQARQLDEKLRQLEATCNQLEPIK